MTDADSALPSSAGRPRRAWSPEGGVEAAEVLRLLALRPWLIAGRDDDAMAKVRRNLPEITSALGRLGWALVIERDLVRLRKSPPVRRDAWAALAPSRLACAWFFLLVAAAEAMPPAVGLGKLVAAAKTAAAEAGVTVTGDITERRAIVQALKLLDDRGVVEQVDGDAQSFLRDDEPPVLLAVHHTRLLHVIANFGAADVAADPRGWLRQVEAEADTGRRMRRRLVDDTLVYTADLDEAEADWMRRRVRGDDGEQLAKAFGLHLERRSEGAAFVVPGEAFRYDRELGPVPFPSPGTVPHAALLLCGRVPTSALADQDRPGWLGMAKTEVQAHLAELAEQFGAGRGGWRADLVESPGELLAEVQALLTGLDLVRVALDDASTWWFSPATARWSAQPSASAHSRRSRQGDGQPLARAVSGPPLKPASEQEVS
jgi:uncharacterized protein (TIGR02678 family)